MKKVFLTLITIILFFTNIVIAETIGTVKTNGLNVREGAGTNFKSIMKLNSGNKVSIISEEGDWYKVEVNGKEGYVNKKYVDKTDNNSNTNGSETNTSNKTKITADSTLYVLPLLNSTKIDEIKKDEEVTLVSVNGAWSYVYSGNNSGWLFSKNLESTEIKVGQVIANSNEQANNISENNVTNNTNNTNSTNESTNKVAETNENTTIQNSTENTVNTAENSVSKNENTTNSVSTSKSTTSNTTNEDKSKVTYPVIMYVNVSAAYVRSSANTNSNIVTSLGINTSVRVISKEGDWYKVETGSGNGYMKESLLSLSKK